LRSRCHKLNLNEEIRVVGEAVLGYGLQVTAASIYPTRLEDSKAVYVTPGQDTGEAIQAAINKVQETTVWGFVFVPEGRYRITRTIYVWPGVRVIGYGANRPVFGDVLRGAE
jgi:hypothetical protein